jgi:polysaccharide deacetylase 2 family uncharacterized protein YibQ
VPTRRKPRRRKRSPIVLVLFLVGVLCCIAAAAMWLWSPDGAPQNAAAPPAARPTSAIADIPEQPQIERSAVPVAADTPIDVATPHQATDAPEAEAVTTAPITSEAPSAPPLETPRAAPVVSGNAPRLAIIIDDCGQWLDTEHAFIALPFPVTLSVLPHVRYGSVIARAADAAGKGVMLHLPMQTISGRYPGPGTITVSMADDAIRSEVSADLAELPQARGVNNHEGSRATQDTRVMSDIADVLAHDGRFFIDSRTSGGSVGESVARTHGVPSASRSVFLDNVDNEALIEVQLREAARDARANGSAIAIGHPRPATLAAVRALGPKFAADGIELTLASALVH